MSFQRRAFGGAADLALAVDLARALPAATRHVVDFPWRLTAPDVASGRDAACWQDADGRVVGLAAWQQVWEALDFYVRPGPGAAAVERAVFAWAGGRFRERDAERGHPVPYPVEFRDDDQGREALTAAHGFVNGRHAANAYFECRLATLPRTAARAAYRAVGFEQAHTIWRQEAWAADVS